MSGQGLFVIAGMFLLLWLVLIRPQRRKLIVQQQMQSSVEIGDEVLTAAGIYGVVQSIGEHDELNVEIAPGPTVRVARRAIGAVIPPDEPDVGAAEADASAGANHS